MSVLLLALLAAAPEETLAAREQARLCEEGTGDDSVAACRRALALGLGPRKAASVRQLLALHLASLERWDELVELYREAARLFPEDAEAQLRLGSALLLAGGRAEEAMTPLQESARLRPEDARPQVLLGLALVALERHAEAVSAFEEALRLDPTALDERPAARAALEAARNRSPWP